MDIVSPSHFVAADNDECFAFARNVQLNLVTWRTINSRNARFPKIDVNVKVPACLPFEPEGHGLKGVTTAYGLAESHLPRRIINLIERLIRPPCPVGITGAVREVIGEGRCPDLWTANPHENHKDERNSR